MTPTMIAAAHAELIALHAAFELIPESADADLDAAVRSMAAAERAVIRSPITSLQDAAAVAETMVLLLDDDCDDAARELASKLASWLKAQPVESVGG